MDSKKEKELSILEDAIQIGLSDPDSSNEAKSFLQSINCTEFDRHGCPNECPDFIRLASSHGSKPRLIGIEHFRVDHFCYRRNNGEIASAQMIYENCLQKLYDKYHEDAVNSSLDFESAMRDIDKLLQKSFSYYSESLYANLIESFTENLKKHAGHIKTYVQNLSSLSQPHFSSELCFLIEIHCKFNLLFLSDERGFSKLADDISPLFSDYIRVINSSIYNTPVKHVILFLYNDTNRSKSKVYVFKTNSINYDLKMQSIRTYEYLGEDYLINKFNPIRKNTKLCPVYDFKDDRCTVSYSYSCDSISPESRMELQFSACHQALICKKKNVNFVTTLSVQFLLECFSDHICGWEKIDAQNSWRIYPVFTPFYINELENRSKLFDRKWNIGEQT